jgi:16S rRNA (guanine1207-N2)-methyltransferase
MDQYFSPRPAAASRPRTVQARLRGRVWTFLTDRGVFARSGVDPGTRALIEAMRVEPRDRVLDLGCGYGPIGLVAAALAPEGRATLVDVNERAAALAVANARRHRLANVDVFVGDGTAPVRDRVFDVVAMNPPIRAGRAVLRRLLDEIHDVLRPGGRLYLVVRTAQGAKTLAREIEQRVGPVRELARQSGYRVYEAVRDV